MRIRRLVSTDLGCDEAIYKHFASLTEKLLSPISRYLLTATSSPSYVLPSIPDHFTLHHTDHSLTRTLQFNRFLNLSQNSRYSLTIETIPFFEPFRINQFLTTWYDEFGKVLPQVLGDERSEGLEGGLGGGEEESYG